MTVWKFLTSHNSPGEMHGDEAHIPHKSCSDPSTCASDSYISEKTHKFSPTCVYLDVKNCNYDHSLCLSLVHRASDRMRRYGTAYFANIRIRIIRALFHIKHKKNCAILAIKQLPYKPKRKTSEAISVILKKFFS